jgi:hypothetical protein
VRHRARSKGGARGRHDRGRGGGRRPRLHRIKVSAAGGRAGRGSATAPFHGGARWRPRLQPPRLHAPALESGSPTAAPATARPHPRIELWRCPLRRHPPFSLYSISARGESGEVGAHQRAPTSSCTADPVVAHPEQGRAAESDAC